MSETEQQILNDVTGSDQSLIGKLFTSNSAPSTSDTGSSGTGSSGFFSNIENFVGEVGSQFGTLTSGSNPALMLGTAASALVTATGSTSAALAFITNIPRMTTTLLGLVLIIAGIFALSRGPAVQIVGGAIKEAVIS